MQGAALAGARNVVAIDPLANKREMAEQLGATHSCETAEQAQELITTTYTLDQINQGYQDLLDGKNVRGVIVYGS